MHRLLEQYVDEVNTGLNRLPVHERLLEIEEIKTHLQSLAVAHTEMGDSEEQAVRNAIHQFGNPRQVAHGLRQSYRRKVNKSRRFRDTLAGAFGAGVCSTLLSSFCMTIVVPWFYVVTVLVGYALAGGETGSLVGGWYAFAVGAIFYLKTLLSGALIAGLTYCMTPKRAVGGTVIAVFLMVLVDVISRYLTSTSPYAGMPPLVDREGWFVYPMAVATAMLLRYAPHRFIVEERRIA